MNTVIKSKTRKYNILFIHILLWGVFFVLPNFFIDRDVLFRWDRFVRSLPTMLGFMVVFYINYFYLIDKFLFKGKKKRVSVYQPVNNCLSSLLDKFRK